MSLIPSIPNIFALGIFFQVTYCLLYSLLIYYEYCKFLCILSLQCKLHEGRNFSLQTPQMSLPHSKDLTQYLLNEYMNLC